MSTLLKAAATPSATLLIQYDNVDNGYGEDKVEEVLAKVANERDR